MTSIFSDGALHPGRDANDSAWLVVRRPEDWAGATLTDVVGDAAGTLTLRPAPFASPPSLAGTVVGPDGTVYRADPAGDRVLRRRPCDATWSVLIGGRGTTTGLLRRPLGLALDARRGLLAIADADNHRVQVVRADSGEPVIVLGCIDAWGAGVAPGPTTGGHALAEPVAVAFGGARLVIADRTGGRVHVYDDRFRWLSAFAAVPRGAPAGFAPAPIAIALVGCVVWVIDAGWSLAFAYDLDGTLVADHGPPPDELAPWLVLARFVSRGELVHGPFDGTDEGLAWHRVIVDAKLPPGTAIEVQTFASDDPIPPAAIAWAPARPVRIPVPTVEHDGENARLVLSDHGRWERRRGEPYLRTARSIVRLAGTGPVNSDTFRVPWAAARKLRAGDDIELTTAVAPPAPSPITLIAGRTISGVMRGDPHNYGHLTQLALIERDGEAPLGGVREIAELGTGDLLDLGSALDDGTLYDLPASHAVAALLRDGDVIELHDPIALKSATVVIATIDHADANVTIGAPVAGDYSTGALRLVTAHDRLVLDELAWRDGVPAGEPIVVHDDIAGTEVNATIRWSDSELATLWLDPLPPAVFATWTRFAVAEPIATDRGRYLWLRLRLLGAIRHAGDALAFATPAIRSVRLLMPRLSLLRYLPAVYARRDADDPSGAVFLERLLALPERRLTEVEATYESVARELNPVAASPEWLRFIAAWFGLVFDPSWPIERRRVLVREAHALFAHRGTLEGMRRYLEIYTGTSPAIVESFRYRQISARPVGGGGILGQAALGAGDPDAGDALAHHFSIWVFGDGGICAADVTRKAAQAIVESTKPAHTTYDLHVVDGSPRIGIASTVGVDMVLVGGELPPSPLGLAPRPPHVLGTMHLPISRNDGARVPIASDLTLT